MVGAGHHLSVAVLSWRYGAIKLSLAKGPVFTRISQCQSLSWWLPDREMPATADHRSHAYQGDSKHKGKFFTANMNKRSNECRFIFLQKTQFLFDSKEKFTSFLKSTSLFSRSFFWKFCNYICMDSVPELSGFWSRAGYDGARTVDNKIIPALSKYIP